MTSHVTLAQIALGLGGGKLHQARVCMTRLCVDPVGVATTCVEDLVAALVVLGLLALCGCDLESANLAFHLVSRLIGHALGDIAHLLFADLVGLVRSVLARTLRASRDYHGCKQCAQACG